MNEYIVLYQQMDKNLEALKEIKEMNKLILMNIKKRMIMRMTKREKTKQKPDNDDDGGDGGDDIHEGIKQLLLTKIAENEEKMDALLVKSKTWREKRTSNA